MRLRFALLPVLGVLGAMLVINPATSGNGQEDRKADSPKLPALTPFYREVRRLAFDYYPKVTSHQLKRKIHFEHNTRVFIVHIPDMSGEWQDPSEQRGPNKGGILCDMELGPGKYGGTAGVPQTFDHHYYKVHLMAPYSKKYDCHLYVHLYYPANVSPKFLKQFQDLINDFEKHLAVEK